MTPTRETAGSARPPAPPQGSSPCGPSRRHVYRPQGLGQWLHGASPAEAPPEAAARPQPGRSAPETGPPTPSWCWWSPSSSALGSSLAFHITAFLDGLLWLLHVADALGSCFPTTCPSLLTHGAPQCLRPALGLLVTTTHVPRTDHSFSQSCNALPATFHGLISYPEPSCETNWRLEPRAAVSQEKGYGRSRGLAMAEHFRDASCCLICLAYLEKPVLLKCGYVCCLPCLGSLEREPEGKGFLCPFCPVVSQKEDIRSKSHLGELVSKIQELEPQLRAALQMNPRVKKFHATPLSVRSTTGGPEDACSGGTWLHTVTTERVPPGVGTLRMGLNVALDVDTANNYLIISEDLREVRCRRFQQARRRHAERFTYALCVLGSPRFTSGRHYWEVDVGGSREWDVGVCRESVPRQGAVLLSSELGFWTMGVRTGGLFSASTVPLTALWVSPQLQRLGVFLDMDMGVLSFFDVRDGSHIFTFTRIAATDPLRPFFAPANAIQHDQGSLSICPGTKLGAISPPHCPGQAK
ncbi:Ret finger protein-like 4A [Tupaia chinensis]|uniref:Ret finger protein-like 4A n=1 Tax=Tupaia chinensis TaxID=246437 RepID=L9KPA1_TUPCH|nr:Ret finger protein-like 4A [Tupaia chinensis]